MAGRGYAGQDATAVEALLGYHYAQITVADVGEVIDLRTKEACTGLTLVFLSRAKRQADLMVEPMSFDRIGKLGNFDNVKARLGKEVRLMDLAQSARGRCTGMGVSNAVAAS